MDQEVKSRTYRSYGENATVGFSKLFVKTEEGQRIYYPKLKFTDFELVLKEGETIHSKGYDFPHEGFITLLERHPGNKKNGGDTFWEQSDLEKAMQTTGGFYARVPDGGLSEEDIKKLDFLERVSNKMAPPQKDQVFDVVDELYTRLSVVNYKKPGKLYNMRRMKAWIILFLSNLEDVEVFWRDDQLKPKEEEEDTKQESA